MKQKKVELCVPGSLIWSQIDDYLDTDLIGGGKQRIEALYECYDKIEWLDFDELK